MNWLIWAEFVANLTTAVATSQGADNRSIQYLQLLTSGVHLTQMTESDLAELKARYEEDVANDRPVTKDELDEVAARLQARSAAIQGD